MTYFVLFEQEGETVRLKCETREEADIVRRSFVNYGKCENVRIEVAE